MQNCGLYFSKMVSQLFLSVMFNSDEEQNTKSIEGKFPTTD